MADDLVEWIEIDWKQAYLRAQSALHEGKDAANLARAYLAVVAERDEAQLVLRGYARMIEDYEARSSATAVKLAASEAALKDARKRLRGAGMLGRDEDPEALAEPSVEERE